jgi:uncharacterized protein (TIGR03435 family)
MVVNCQTVRVLIQRAYLMFPDGRINPAPFFLVPISGGPGWLDSDRFMIDAKAEGPASEAMMAGPMLQDLLETRFGLRIHRTSREMPAYELTVARDGPKLKATREESCVPFDRAQPPTVPRPGQQALCGTITPDANGGMVAYGITLEGLCRRLSGALGQVVMDKTGLTGAFDAHLDLSPGDLAPRRPGLQAQTDQTAPPPLSDPVIEIRAAMQKLGLQLRPTKASGEAIIVDHVEKPSDN